LTAVNITIHTAFLPHGGPDASLAFFGVCHGADRGVASEAGDEDR
jgi:hypothetical protein